ncbi:MAG: F0F1 ATP synthase subunit gamma [Bacteroidia bacterium]|nr:F0F1 ATP synthase subunit gamma [Bacteroidia bacterium]
MASLKETKERITSVKSTLKITSAMKMVASAKLHKAQSAIENMLPYERKLQEMLQLLLASLNDIERSEVGIFSSQAGGGSPFTTRATLGNVRGGTLQGGAERSEAVGKGLTANGDFLEDKYGRSKVAIVAVSSNSSLCGGFNSNAIRETRNRIAELTSAGERIEVISVGKKMAEAMRKAGYPSSDWSDLLNHPSYQSAADFARTQLVEQFNDGKYSRIELIYNHFVSTSSQKARVETYLPMDIASSVQPGQNVSVPEDFILEPTAREILEGLRPQVLALRIYTVILDSLAAEHAARTVAMQTATENGENILQELTLEYNKGRQQKITNEILDIVGGSLK